MNVKIEIAYLIAKLKMQCHKCVYGDDCGLRVEKVIEDLHKSFDDKMETIFPQESCRKETFIDFKIVISECKRKTLL